MIREQFPVALIDEFQDTDPVQYRIFERIYRIAADPDEPQARETGLFMIGDPKQAIYAFRGADIHTYLRAREALAGGITPWQELPLDRRHGGGRQPLLRLRRRAPARRLPFRPRGAGKPVPFHAVDAQGAPNVC